MSGFILVALIVLVFVIIYQIAKASEYATILRGEEKVSQQTNRLMAWLLLIFMIVGIYGVIKYHYVALDMLLPAPASEHGESYEMMMKATVIITGSVFFLTQALLFWFAFKFQHKEGRKAAFIPHNNKLELIWTTVPAIALAVLVAIGLRSWGKMTGPAPEDAVVVEVIGKQFNWIIRYPGEDGIMGKRSFRDINDVNNVLGMDWNDKSNLDDIVVENGEIHLVKGKPVQLIIGSRDVLHDVGLPHFRLKMDAVPGITTTLWFTPLYTTEEMKEMTGNPNFVYELTCAEMCGKGHYAMRGTVIVHTQESYDEWMSKQVPYYINANPQAATGASESTPADADTNESESANDQENAITMR